ncbi:N-acetylmannosamine kinase [Inquilinus sp. Marseille-Q2685]|uniref:N-acetylmannosamine kinase n=1 Tax=Inquilinus sp. Marseille-Q2685 TaxID=2866581 RepID=UPI001CE3D284|nr:N-acetylmannosamine kinase [Inquilinus sp. Marseille-Q2685]
MTTVVDLGGTKIAAARVAGAKVLERRQAPTPRDGRFESLVEAVAALVAGWADGPVGVATTGLVRDGRLSATNPGTLPVPPDSPLVAALQDRLGVTVRAVNDAQAAAWGEFRDGAAQGVGSTVFLTVSTGVGGGLVLDGRLRVGPGGLAGHLGHVVAVPDGPLCGCGRRGCVEAVASGRALAAAATEAFGEEVDTPSLFRRAETDPTASALIDRAAAAIARLLADLKAALDLDLAVIGGGVGLADGFLSRVELALAAEPRQFRLPLRPAALGHDAGLIGMADLMVADQPR